MSHNNSDYDSDYDMEGLCLVCEVELTENDYKALQVCEACMEEYSVGRCDWCDMTIAMDCDRLEDGEYFPVPPNTETEDPDFYLCIPCQDDYKEG